MTRPDDQLLAGLLAATSRTFALTIPYLPEPTRREVTLAYLLLRIADTVEDGSWPRERKAAELSGLSQALRACEPAALRAIAARLPEAPAVSEECSGLLAQAGAIFEALLAVPEEARAIVARYTSITAAGMAESALRQDGAVLRLSSLPELRDYCYYVAGAVGELLTELFLVDWPGLTGRAQALRRDARAFGEGLQLTNILKDAADDAREGRHFVPASVAPATLFELARADLQQARRYVGTLREAQAPPGILAFTALPVRLAAQTLEAVEQRGAGAKVARAAVVAAVQELDEALTSGELPRLLERGWMLGDAGSSC